jgi:hypothetical protein
MPKPVEKRAILVITTSNRAWVVNELDQLRKQWSEWLQVAMSLPDSPEYDRNTCAEVIKDGRDNIKKHAVLREKTLTFIANNFEGYEFLFFNWPSHPHEDNLSRLVKVIPGWIHRLEMLAESIEYARVPDTFWKSKGKQLVEKVVSVSPDKAAEIAASWLKNPFGE